MIDVARSTEAEASERTAAIRGALTRAWELLIEAWQLADWYTLGYSSWDEYLDCEYGSYHVKLPRAERREVCSSMADVGMSQREIGAALGVNEGTVNRDLARSRSVENATDDDLEHPVIDAEVVDCGEDEETDVVYLEIGGDPQARAAANAQQIGTLHEKISHMLQKIEELALAETEHRYAVSAAIMDLKYTIQQATDIKTRLEKLT